VQITDQWTDQRSTVRVPDPNDPADTLTRVYGETFSTGVDWNTGIGLPVLFAGTWRLSPHVGIQNTTGGPFMLRNQYTGGRWVQQGKRLSFGASISPALFGFFPGFGPLQRIRHAISPSVSWQYTPAASVPEEYLRAQGPATGLRPQNLAQHTITFGFSQTFEAKLKPPPGDTLAAQNPRKIKLLSIQTSSVSYDFEQAKDSGRTGWTTQNLSNTFTSDLLPGFSLSMAHDLWKGRVGTDSAQFSPFLTSISTRFSLSAGTFRRIAALVTGGPAPAEGAAPAAPAPPGTGPSLGPPLGPIGTSRLMGTEEITAGRGGGAGLSMSVGFDAQRSRDVTTTAPGVSSGDHRTLTLSTNFSPTSNWSVSWQTLYDLTNNQFGQHILRLDRNLRRWRATFSFLKSPNGNFAFNFNIVLLDESDIKFRYDQQTVRNR
jgi:hypothetical protein